MNTTIHKFTLFFTTCFLGCMTGHAYEQDNWYLAWEKSIVSPFGVETWENNNTGVEQIYLCHGSNSASKISVYDLNGSFSRDIQIANARNHAVDLTIDENGTLFISERYSVTCIANDGTFKWRLGKGSSISNVGTSGQLEGEFNQDADQGVGVGILDSNIYVTDYYNHRVQVLDVNGSYKMQFSSYGTAPGTIQNPMDLDILDNKIIVASRVTNYLNIFTEDGSFLNRFQIAGNHQSHHVTVFNDTFVYRGKLYSPSIETITQGTPLSSSEHIRYAFTNNGDLWSYKGEFNGNFFNGKGLERKEINTQVTIKEGEFFSDNLYQGLETILYKNSGVEITSEYVKGIATVVDRNDINSFKAEDIVGLSESTEIDLLQRGTIFDARLAYDVELEINGIKGEWLLDSGAMGFTIGNIMFERLKANGINYKDLNRTVKSFGIGGEAYGDLVVLEEVKIGDYIVKNVVATVLDTPTSLLGTGFLLKFSNVIWNMKDKKLTVYK